MYWHPLWQYKKWKAPNSILFWHKLWHILCSNHRTDCEFVYLWLCLKLWSLIAKLPVSTDRSISSRSRISRCSAVGSGASTARRCCRILVLRKGLLAMVRWDLAAAAAVPPSCSLAEHTQHTQVRPGRSLAQQYAMHAPRSAPQPKHIQQSSAPQHNIKQSN